MPRWLRLLGAGLAAWLALAGASSAAEPGQPPREAAHQVLVLLRMAPGHYRASSDYSDSYGDEAGRSARRRVVLQLAREQGLSLATDWPMPILGVDCFVLSVPADRSTDSVAAELSRDRRVAWAQPMNLFHANAAPARGDPLFAAQPAAQAWRLNDLHQISTGQNVRVAVIDSMVDAAHPDLAGQIEVRRNFAPDRGELPETHGTGVAGVIAARGDNGVGIVGVAPNARLMALRACWQQGAPSSAQSATVCDSLSLAMAIDFAIAHKAQVVNLSLSGPKDPLLGRLLDAALARGMSVVGAFDPTLPGGGFPASHAGVIAATDDSTLVAADGIYLAPGRGVPTTEPAGRWSLVNGSSYAAAHVSGLFALLRQRNPHDVRGLALVATRGGAVDACASLMRAARPCDCNCPRTVASAR